MRKTGTIFLAVLLMATLALGGAASAEVKLGQAIYAAHGTYAFCVATVAMEGDTISAAIIEEFQYLGEGFEPVPNPETFTREDGNILSSKRLNDEAYSANMANAGSTQSLVTSYKAIEEYVVGKTIAELEALVAGDAEGVADAVSSSTLVDTDNYIRAIIEAAKAI